MGFIDRILRTKKYIHVSKIKAWVYPRGYNLKVYSLRRPHICRNIKDFIEVSSMLWKKKQPTDKTQKTALCFRLPGVPVWKASLSFQCFYSDGVTYCMNNWDSNNTVTLKLPGKLMWAMLVTFDLIISYITKDSLYYGFICIFYEHHKYE